MRFFSRVPAEERRCITRVHRSLRRVALRMPWRGPAGPVPLGPGFFLYTLSEYISPSRICIRTYWDMWDHWDHPYESIGCWSRSFASVPLSTGATRRYRHSRKGRGPRWRASSGNANRGCNGGDSVLANRGNPHSQRCSRCLDTIPRPVGCRVESPRADDAIAPYH